ncbi:TetR/AcrR family transcriptional regulator [Alkalihalobacillus sp. MEB130]|uniref:TetR/AcrR family transcriptional regulator n=1 Tax=Alkalihalobacillus sp. MEB130 TaxID=2976704 RepID=UPI0028DD6980|nr:TetR/AcrR family transcriptional regulator [Alkalihalobacillus sp. MEB130]MDT8861794.1 TetR/AcrR family transcriptional regulator [Alkalihalobacillus sp. MEB130]
MKEKIIEVSIGLFGKNGFTETSIQDIVEELGVTKGTFYYYFKSKEELLMEIHLRYIEDLLVSQEEIVNQIGTQEQKLFEMVYMLMKHIEGHGQSARVFFREMQHLNENHLKDIFKKSDQFKENIKKVIEAGINEGEFRKDLHANIVTLAILGAVNWSYHWFDPKGELDEKAVSKIYIDLMLNGLKETER